MTFSSWQRTPVAIIGLASIFPQASNLRQYWDNIIKEVDCITDVPPSRWSIEDYYDPDPNMPDKTYCKRGGFIPDIDFNPMDFGIPPNILEATDVSQLLSLVVAKEAMKDAGYGEASNFNREHTGVILGVTVGRQLGVPLGSRLQYPIWERVLKNSGLSDEETQQIIERIKAAYVSWQESSFPGILGNVVAGRIANRLNLGGINCVVDAACASSLGAVKMAVSELVEHRTNMMLVGGVDTDNSILMYMCFSKTPAFSQQDKVSPFDVASDGMMVGEGIGMLVLKRLEDAERDNDRIYAVIRGIGASSDGRYKSIYAPRPEGQVQALKRAYQDAGFPPDSVGLIEAHGTGTIAGDLAEVTALNEVFSENNPQRHHIALGSVKSQIGHTKAAAGAASLIKTALALHHKILPPTINVTQPHPSLKLETSPFYLNTKTRPWIRANGDPPRRAGVSSFGFGGTNFHVVLEEIESEHQQPYRLQTVAEAILLAAQTPTQLLARCEDALLRLQSGEGEMYYQELLEASRSPTISPTWARVGFVAESRSEACEMLETALSTLQNKLGVEDALWGAESWSHPKGIHYRQAGMDLQGRVVALFPGQGSPYLEMGRELALTMPPLREAYRAIDTLFSQDGLEPVSNKVFPSPVFDQAAKAAQAETLRRTEYAQPAIAAFSVGLYKVMQQAGFRPDFVAGHSFGELTALWAANVLDDQTYFSLVKARGQAMAPPTAQPDFDAGAMLAVTGEIGEIQAAIDSFSGVTIANLNANNQAVLAGPTPTIKQAKQSLIEQGYSVVLLPVSAAFHTALVGHAQQPFAQAIKAANFNPPQIPIYANTTGGLYPSEPEAIKNILADHLLKPVLFKQQIETIYAAGGYCFIEIGPGNILTNLVKSILGDKPHLAFALNASSKKDSDRQFREAVLQLRVIGLPLRTVDPYQAPQQVPETNGKTAITVHLNGNNYISEKTRIAMEKALQDEGQITRSVITERPIPPIAKSAPPTVNAGNATLPHAKRNAVPASPQTSPISATSQPPAPPPPVSQPPHQDLRPSGLDHYQALKRLEQDISQFVNQQNEVVRVHEQYLNNQGEYAKIFFQLMQQQYDIFSNTPEGTRGNLSLEQMETIQSVLKSLGQSMMRFHDHQDETGRIHKQYLTNQGDHAKSFFQLLQQQYALLFTGESSSPLSADPPNPPEGGTSALLRSASSTAASASAPPLTHGDASVAVSPTLTSSQGSGFRVQGSGFSEMPSGVAEPAISPASVPAPALEPLTHGDASVAVSHRVTTQIPEPPMPVPTAGPSSTSRVPRSGGVSGAIDIQTITNALLEVVGEKTGYPLEVLELDMDMEADLGIDSIKRVEILSAMQDHFSELPQVDPEGFGELRTLGQIIDFVKVNLPSNTPYPRGILREGISDGNLSSSLEPPNDALPLYPGGHTSDLRPSLLGSSTSVPAHGANMTANFKDLPNSGPTPVPSTTSSGTIDIQAITNTLLEVVGEKTGYPLEVLELDMDMEADLGIDSIKRVEILSAMQDQFPELPQVDPEGFGELRTLGQIIDFVKVNLPSNTPYPRGILREGISDGNLSSSLEPPNDALKETSERAAISATLFEIVSENTGYPIEVLESEMDLEGDLGIDRVKLVEILAALRDRFPQMPDLAPEVLSELPTLGQIVDAVAVQMSEMPSGVQTTPLSADPPNPPYPGGHLREGGTSALLRSASSTETVAPEASQVRGREAERVQADETSTPGHNVYRHRVSLKPLPAPDFLDFMLAENHSCILTDDGSSTTVEVVRALSARGWRVVVLSFPPSIVPNSSPLPEGARRVVLEDLSEAHLKSQLFVIAKEYGHVGAFIGLMPASPVEPEVGLHFLETEKAILKHIFLTAKYLKQSLNDAALKGRSCFLTAARLDGQFGLGTKTQFRVQGSGFRVQGSGNSETLNSELRNSELRNSDFGVIGAGLFGLTKTLNLEWPSVFCRAVDVSCKLEPYQAAAAIIAELHDPNADPVEVGYSDQGRVTLVGKEAPLTGNLNNHGPGRNKIDRSSVFLVSGGAKGITAECVIKLAAYYRCQFILLGRSSITDTEPAWAADCFDEAELKQRIVAQLNSDGEKPTPLRVENVYKSITSKREVEKTLRAIEQAGGQAQYLSVDVTDGLALKAKLAEAVQTTGPITGLIHGAGNIADKWIEKKTEQDFDLVYDTKVKGLENLLQCVPVEQLAQVILFSSTAGFQGNIGQADYALANEVLNKAAHLIKRYQPACHVVSFNWGPWDGGMVTPTLKKILARQNIPVIPIELGAQMFVDELNAADPNAPQIVCSCQQQPNSPLISEILASAAPPGPPYPVPQGHLTRGHLREGGGSELRMFRIYRKLSLEANPFLYDHAIGGQPVLPFTCAISWMANACEQLHPSYRFFEGKNLKLLKGIVFPEISERALILDLKEISISSSEVDLEAKIWSQNDQGKIRYHYQGQVKLVRQLPAAPPYESLNLVPDQTISGPALYQNGTLFHGPCFQGVDRVLNLNTERLTMQCILPQISEIEQGQFPARTFNPYTTDVQLHSGLIWTQHFYQEGCLPTRISQIEQFAAIPHNEIFYVTTEIQSKTETALVVNSVSHNAQGQIYTRLLGFEATVSKRLSALFKGSGFRVQGGR